MFKLSQTIAHRIQAFSDIIKGSISLKLEQSQILSFSFR
jgi:hypothetical protein